MAAICAIVLVVVGLTAPAHAATLTPAPTNLTVQGIASPVDLDTLSSPKLGWQPSAIDRTTVAPTVVDQSAYEIVVSSTADLAASGSGDVWDSGKVVSTSSQNVAYAGHALSTSDRYWFSVRTWDGTGAESSWAAPSTFGTGPGKAWSNATPIWSQTPTNAWTNYTIAGTFTIGANAATVLFRGADASNYYLWQFRGATNTLAAEVKVKGVLSNPRHRRPGRRRRSRWARRPHAFSVSRLGHDVHDEGRRKVPSTRDPTAPSLGLDRVADRIDGVSRVHGSTVTAHNGVSLWAQSTSSSTSDFSCATVSSGTMTVAPSRSCSTTRGRTTSWTRRTRRRVNPPASRCGRRTSPTTTSSSS